MFDNLGLISIGSATMAFLLNIGLLPVIAFRSGKNIGSYKILLFIDTLIAALYAVGHAILVPGFFVHDGVWVFYSTNSYVPVTFSITVVFSFSLGYILIIEALCVSFFYRLAVMKRRPGDDGGWFTSKNNIIMVVVGCAAVAFYMTFIQVYCFMPNHEFADSVQAEFSKQSPNQLNEVGYMGGNAFNKDGSINSSIVNVIVSYSVVIASGIILMLYCTFKIVQEFRASTSVMTKNTSYDKMQKRLFILLVIQTVFPFCFTLTPPLILFMMSLFRMSPGTFPAHWGVGLAFASVIEPILIVYFITDYRKTILHFILPKYWVNSSIGTTTTS